MKLYKSLSGKPSGVVGFEIGDDFIRLKFSNGQVYTYSYESCGKQHVESMVKLALRHRGLSTYVSREQPQYDM